MTTSELQLNNLFTSDGVFLLADVIYSPHVVGSKILALDYHLSQVATLQCVMHRLTLTKTTFTKV